MSDTTTTDEPRDVAQVLSSIRKMVSQETRARLHENLQHLPEPASAKVLPLKLSRDAAVSDEPPVLRLEPKAPSPDAKPPLLLTPASRPEPYDAAPQNPSPRAPSLLDEDMDTEAEAPFQDEIALRRLVSEMIRDELQGELGERITRNVRKLIQREIKRALEDSKSD